MITTNQPVPYHVHRKSKLVYLLAASHSGSTLLAMLLNSHPEICTVGELKLTSLGDIERYRCSCQENIQKCVFWTSIRNDMKSRGVPFDIARSETDIRFGASRYVRWLLRPLHRGRISEGLRDAALSLSKNWRSLLPRIQATNAALIECILERTGKAVIVDSSKIGIRLKYLLRNPALDVRVIRIIRDGRGVALTYMDPAQFADSGNLSLRGGGMGGNRNSERLPMTEAAREWRRSNEEAEAILRRIDRSKWTELSYETLSTQPAETLSQLFTFIGVNPRRANTDFRSVEHHIIGNGMRLDSTSEIRLDDRWKSVLSPSDLAIFDSVAGEMNRRLGYL